jgi:hypothetical protein
MGVYEQRNRLVDKPIRVYWQPIVNGGALVHWSPVRERDISWSNADRSRARLQQQRSVQG